MARTDRRFRILQHLADGAFSTLYLAEQRSSAGLARGVVLKLLHPRWSRDDEVVKRARDEARLLGHLHHANIVRVEDLTSIDGRVALILENLDGIELKQMARFLVERRLEFPRAAVFEIIRAVASALDAAYAAAPRGGGPPLKVIHGDIKPSNIFVTVDGSIKLHDFAIARSRFPEQESRTQALPFGSPGYMPPERMLGEEDTPAADIFSLGITLYELLTLESFGRIPPRPNKFQGKVDERVASVPLEGDPEWIQQVRDTLRLMLAYAPADRPTARQLVEIMDLLAQEASDMGLRRYCRAFVPEAREALPITSDPLTGTMVDEDEPSTAGMPAPTPAAPRDELLVHPRPDRTAPPKRPGSAGADRTPDGRSPRISRPIDPVFPRPRLPSATPAHTDGPRHPPVTDSHRADDPGSHAIFARHRFPHPIAVLYARQADVTHRPGLRYGRLLKLAEGLVRFVALVNAADAFRRAPPPKKIKRWLLGLRGDSFGKTMFFNDEMLSFLGESPFLDGVAAPFADGQVRSALDRMVEARNDLAHRDIAISDGKAQILLAEREADMHLVVEAFRFLCHYRLGCFDRIARGTQSEHVWVESTGQVDFGRTVLLFGRGSDRLQEGAMLLVAPERNAVLPLAPFFVRDELRSARTGMLSGPPKEGQPEWAYANPQRDDRWDRAPPAPDDPDGLADDAAWLKVWSEATDVPSLHFAPAELARLHMGSTDPASRKFRFVGLLGRGGMGEVWEAEHLGLSRRVAVKRLHTGLFGRKQEQQLRREGTILAQLDHPNIVKVHDAGDDDGHPYVEMELIEGEPLHRELARAPLALQDAVGVLFQILDALTYLHAQRPPVLHRDLKPSNLIRSERGIRLIDFGIAREGTANQTRGSAAIGTLNYMAPEQLRGEASVQSDLFAAGRVFYALLIGEDPQPMRQQTLRDRRPEVSEAIERVYLKATLLAEEARYRSAAEMSLALQAAIRSAS